MSQGGSGKGKNVAHNKLSVEEAFNELNKPEGSITLDEAVAELPYTSEAIQNYPVYTPTWHQPNLTDNDLAESADRIMRLLELAMNMISNKAFLDDGLTLMYALGRNFSLVKKGTTWEYIFRDSMLSGPRFKTEHDSTFDNMWEASVTSDKLKDYIEKTYSSLTIQGAGYFRSVGNNTPPIHKIAYCGMFSCLMLRSIVKDKMSLGYLYAVKEKQQNKLEQFFVAFYGAVPPYSIRVHDSVLFHANIQTPNNKEARSLMFHGFLLFEDREKHKDSLRVLGACFIQTLMNFGLPAVTWAMKAARVGRLGDLKTFLGAIATQDLETSIANIVSYSKFYVTATGDKLHYVARILNSDYFKSLGREPNDTLIISCYLICYVNASEEERKRLIRYNAPQDPTLYGRAFLYQYLKHIRTKSIQKSTRSSNSIMNTSKPLEINEKKLEKEVDELYGEAMKRVLQRAEAEKEEKIDGDDEEDESESEGEGSDRDEKEEDDGNEKDGKEEDVEL